MLEAAATNNHIKIAHFSDPHIIYLRHAWHSLRNSKQLLGFMNWVMRRRRKHNRNIIKKAVRLVMERECDIVVVTGDICQLALPYDYAAFARMVKPLTDANIPVIILQGNHDHYSGREDSYTAYRTIRDHLSLGLDNNTGIITYNDTEFISLDAAVITPSFKCYGVLDPEEITRLEETLAQTSGENKLRLAYGHFPLLNSKGEELEEFMAMQNAPMAMDLIANNKISAYLCGHIHKPFVTNLPGDVTQYCSGTITGGGVLRFFTGEGNKLTETELVSCF